MSGVRILYLHGCGTSVDAAVVVRRTIVVRLSSRLVPLHWYASLANRLQGREQKR